MHVLILLFLALSSTLISSLGHAAPQPPSESAIGALRTQGQPGVDALRAAAPGPADPNHDAWQRALDRVCAQRDCWASGLFWHTDFDRAVTEAERSGRPILSLRLLGRFDEDRSCANSRFFRTVLYADPAIAGLLRERFVLHWSSERPVPKVSIDFGDGRRLEGTVTGNSIHYVLDPHGRLVDALPGLYGPGLFRRRLEELGELAGRLRGAGDTAFLAARSAHHEARKRELAAEWTVLVADGIEPEASFVQAGTGEPPTARRAALEAATKMVLEMPTVTAVNGDLPGATALDVFAADWSAIASQRTVDWRLSAASRRFLRRSHAEYLRSLPGSEFAPDAPNRALENFERSVGMDTMRNEYQLHRAIHGWLAAATDPATDAEAGIESFNRRVYDELFLTPASDPWLGLMAPEIYAALAPISSP